MSYIQRFGVSRNSPLNDHTKYHCDAGNKNSAGECVGWEYDQKRKKEEANKNDDSNIINKKNKYTKEQLADYSYDSGYNIAGENTFGLTKAEMEDAKIAGENTKKQHQLKGGETWKNSPYNNQPKEGYDAQGNPMTLHKDGKVFFDGKDITEEHERKKRGESTFNENLNNVQNTLDVGGFTPGYGFFADAANSVISGGRGIASLFGATSGDGKTSKDHFKKSGLSLAYSVPYFGDVAAATKVGKFANKLNKRTLGTNLVTRNIGKTNKTKFNYNPQPISGASKNWESKLQNLQRGALGFATGKNYNKFGQGIENLLGKNNLSSIVKSATSSKALTGKTGAALETINTNIVNPFSTALGDTIASLNSTSSEFGKDKKYKSAENPASSIIASNNKKSQNNNLTEKI